MYEKQLTFFYISIVAIVAIVAIVIILKTGGIGSDNFGQAVFSSRTGLG